MRIRLREHRRHSPRSGTAGGRVEGGAIQDIGIDGQRWRCLCSGLLCALCVVVLGASANARKVDRWGEPVPITADRRHAWHELYGKFNMVLVKNYKCGSTTAASVIRRIGRRAQLGGYNDSIWLEHNEPGVFTNHEPRMRLETRGLSRLERPTLVVSIVRDPLQRCMSAFYHFHVRQRYMPKKRRGDTAPPPPTVAQKLEGLRRCRNEIYRFMRPTDSFQAQRLPHKYDLIMNIDRPLESFTVLRNMLGLELHDVLYIPSKNSTIISALKDQPAGRHIPLEEEHEQVQAYAATNFPNANRKDLAILDMANTYIDVWKERFRERWDEQLREYEWIMQQLVQRCAQDYNAVMHDCIYHDNACAQTCIDTVYREAVAAGKVSAPTTPLPPSPPAQVSPTRRERSRARARRRPPASRTSTPPAVPSTT